METTPMATVETPGVRYFGWICANAFGTALYAAIDRVVRAVGRMVVWVEADAEVRIDAESRSRAILPSPESPNRAGPIAAKTTSAMPGSPSPTPAAPPRAYPTA